MIDESLVRRHNWVFVFAPLDPPVRFGDVMPRRLGVIVLTAFAAVTLLAMVDGMRTRKETISIGMGQTMTLQGQPRTWKWILKSGSQIEVTLEGIYLTMMHRPPNLQRVAAIHIPLLALFVASALHPLIFFIRRTQPSKPPRDVSVIVAIAVFVIVGTVAAEVFAAIFWAYYPYFSEDYFLLEAAIAFGELIAAAVIAFLAARLVRRRVRKNHRRIIGLCISCGYDLRGANSSVCSECGEAIEPRRKVRYVKRLLASKLGLIFLVISVGICALFAISTRSYVSGSWSRTTLAFPHGAIRIITSNTREVRIWPRVDVGDRISPWNWQFTLWPAYRRYSNANRVAVYASIPLWMLLAPSITATWCFYRQARSDRRTGSCPRCGYNLTGNKSGVCPECGTPAESS